MASSDQDIYTHEGLNSGPYAHWATEKTLRELLDKMSSAGIGQSDIDRMVNVLTAISEGNTVDSDTLKELLANMRRGSTDQRKRDKDDEDTRDKETDFWKDSKALADKSYKAFKDADISDALGEGGKAFILPMDSMEEAFNKVAGIVSSVGAGFANFGHVLVDSMDILGKWGKRIAGSAIKFASFVGGMLMTAAGGLMGMITALGDTFFQLYDTGINLAAGLSEGETAFGSLTRMASDARLSVGEFAEYVAKNSAVAVAIGANAMGQLSNSVRTALYPLGNLGLTASETNEYIGDYLEMQRGMGHLDRMSQRERADATSEYLTTLTALTQVTGKQRKEIAASLQANLKEANLQAYLQSLSGEQGKKIKETTIGMQSLLNAIDPGMATAFGEGLAKGDMKLTSFGKQMAIAGYDAEVGSMNRLIADTKAGRVSEQEGKKRMAQIMKDMQGNEGARKKLAELTKAGHSSVTDLAAFSYALQGAELNIDKLTAGLDKQTSAVGAWDEMQKAFSQAWTDFQAALFNNDDFNDALNMVSTQLKEIFAPDGDMAETIGTFAKDLAPKLVSGMKGIVDFLKTGGLKRTFETFKGWLDSIMNAFKPSEKIGKLDDEIIKEKNALREAFARGDAAALAAAKANLKKLEADRTTTLGQEGEHEGGIGNAMDEMWGNLFDKLVEGAKNLPWGKIALAIAGIFAGKALLGAVTGGIARKLTGAVGGGGLPDVPGGGGAIGAENTMGAKLGKNVGGLVGGLGEGIMKGAAAGLVAFSNPKIVLGAGILGAAIAAIATGIGAAAWILEHTVGGFAETLKKFEGVNGDALEKTGAGMVALGKGLAYIGGGQIIKAIGNLLGGGSDPFAQILLFQKQKFDIAAIESNAKAMVAFETAMESMPATVKQESAVSAFGLIAKLFGADVVYPWDQVKVFAEADLGKIEAIESNAKAMEAFALAMESMPATVKQESAVSAFGLIAKLFGADVVYPWEQVKVFANADLGKIEAIESNAKAMETFSLAMESMPAAVKQESAVSAFELVAKLFGAEVVYPWEQVKVFADADLGKEEDLVANTNQLKLFGDAVANMPDTIKGKGEFFKGLAGFFGVDVKMPWDQVKDFARADMGDANSLAINAKAMSAFGKAMSTMPESIKGKSNFLSGLAAFFGGKTKMPWDQVKDFAEADMGDTNKLKENAKALTEFGISVSGLSAIPKDIEARLKGLGNGLEEFAKYIDDGEITTITDFATAMSKLGPSLNAFSGNKPGLGVDTTGLASIGGAGSSAQEQKNEQLTQLIDYMAQAVIDQQSQTNIIDDKLSKMIKAQKASSVYSS